MAIVEVNGGNGGSLTAEPLTRWLSEIDRAAIITGFASGHGWTAAAGTGTINLNDTSIGALSGQSVKITNGATGGTAAAIDHSYVLDFTGKSLLVWVNYQGSQDGAGDPQVVVYAGDAALTNYYTWQFSPPNVIPDDGWFCRELFIAAATVVGSPSVSAIAHLRLRVNNTGVGGVTVNFGGVAAKTPAPIYPSGVVTFSFDDANDSDYIYARPTLAAYGFPGVVFPIVDQLGTASHATIAQYQQMVDELGWEVGAHSYTLADHATGFTNLSVGQLALEFQNMKSWLNANGFKGEAWASPQGLAGNREWDQARLFFHSQMSSVSSAPNLGLKQSVPPVAPYGITRLAWDSAEGVAAIKTEIDNAKANRTWLVLNFHAVTVAASSGASISQADLDSIASYCSTTGVAVRTISQVVEETRPRSVKSRAMIRMEGRGIHDEPFSPTLCASAGSALGPTGASSTGYGTLLGYKAGDPVSKGVIFTPSIGSGVTLFKMALFTRSGHLLAVSADTKASLVAGTYLPVPYLTPYIVPSDDDLYSFVLSVASVTQVFALRPGGITGIGVALPGGYSPCVEVTGLSDISGDLTFAPSTLHYWQSTRP